jgi:predicted tellurium resistance membrane protein TerC
MEIILIIGMGFGLEVLLFAYRNISAWPRLITLCFSVLLGIFGMLPAFLLRKSTHSSHASLALTVAYFLVFSLVGVFMLNLKLSRLERES